MKNALALLTLCILASCSATASQAPKVEDKDKAEHSAPAAKSPKPEPATTPEPRASLFYLDDLSTCLESEGIEDETGERKPEWLQEVQKKAVKKLKPIEEFVESKDAYNECEILGLYAKNPADLRAPLPALPGKFTKDEAAKVYAARLKRFEKAMSDALKSPEAISRDIAWHDGMSTGRDGLALYIIEYLYERRDQKKDPKSLGITGADIVSGYQKGLKDRFTAWETDGGKQDTGNWYVLCEAIDEPEENAPKEHGLSDPQIGKLDCDRTAAANATVIPSNTGNPQP